MSTGHRLLRLTAVAACSFALGYGFCAQRMRTDREVAARVNGEAIPAAELRSELLKRFGPDVLRDLVHQRLIMQEAVRRNIKSDTALIDKRLKEMKAQPEVQAMLKSGQLEEADLRRNLTTMGPLDALVKSQLTLEEENQFFKQHRSELESVRVQQILLLDKAEADKVHAEATKAGADFAALAKKYSLDTRTKSQGGLLGEVHRGELMPELAEALFTMKPGQISEPIESEDGIHIFRVVSSKTGLDELRPQIEERLTAARRGDFVEELRASAKIETLSPYRLPASISPTDDEH
ncbi:MAG: peptidylprolyl isomerase [Candidatus Eremiobacteraeota bacterium]|nr:peptidylprolyl isomerase [Candidatus Eremiobacteraeota bacterium]MCW5870821.1 peptidylprolyl isomerase [Candidatus Eremiobacteraeota bacterium]